MKCASCKIHYPEEGSDICGVCEEGRLIARTTAAERAAVVAWLRREAARIRSLSYASKEDISDSNLMNFFANCIERGEHRKEGG